ncbi:MAG: YtoQ family protein [Planctomycetota bacterium]|jgi:YtoQ family protein
MADLSLTVYLSGEIHSDWRERIVSGAAERDLPIEFISPVCDHEASDDVGEAVLGSQPSTFYRDHTAAKINALRIRAGMDRADLVVVRFGPKYKQWNAAFDAGYAAASGTPLITLHDEDSDHALKEIDGVAQATARTPEQVVEILAYTCLKD